MVGTSAVSAYLPMTASAKDRSSAQGQVQAPHQGMLAVLEALEHIVVVLDLVGRYVAVQGRAFDPGALVVGGNLAAVATELDQVEIALVLDDIHSVQLHHLSYLGMVKDTHLVVLEGAYAASHH